VSSRPSHARSSKAISTPERSRVPTSASDPHRTRHAVVCTRHAATPPAVGAARAGRVADRSGDAASTAIKAAFPDLCTPGAEDAGGASSSPRPPCTAGGAEGPSGHGGNGVDRGRTLSSWAVAWCWEMPRRTAGTAASPPADAEMTGPGCACARRASQKLPSRRPVCGATAAVPSVPRAGHGGAGGVRPPEPHRADPRRPPLPGRLIRARRAWPSA
jgi:hypothetical protein